MALNRRLIFALALGVAACAHAPVASMDGLSLAGTDGQTHDFPASVRGAKATLVIFFSSSCPCMRAHDGRLKDLAAHTPGLRVWVVDSEYGDTLASARGEAQSRGYPFPILLDPAGHLADALGAQYATYSVVFDSGGVARYRGGFDSDKHDLHPDAEPWVARAVDAVIAGRKPTRSETEPLGCAIRRW